MEWKILQLANSNILKQIAARSTPSITGAVGSNHNSMTLGIGNVHSLPSLTLSGLNGAIGTSWDSEDWFKASNDVKKYEVYELSEDVLALSVTWQRLRSTVRPYTGGVVEPSPTTLTDAILFKEVTQEDRERANIIRDFYSKKLMVLTLKEHKFSSYRKDLSTFIHGNSKVVKEQMLPIVYRLPEFYDYDIVVEDMFRDLDTDFKDTDQPIRKILKLGSITKLTVNGKSKKFVEYWMKDSSNRPYKLEIEISNQLMHLWDYFFDQGKVSLEIVAKHMNRDGAAYYKLIKWKLA